MRNRWVIVVAVAVLATVMMPVPSALGKQPNVARCLGQVVTVDLRLGQRATSGDDVILGTANNDTIEAGQGDDIVCAGAGNDRIRGGSGNDVLIAGAGNDLLQGDSGNDELIGGSGEDRLLGGVGNDVLRGGDDDDRLLGGDGLDRLLAGGGHDVLRGGGGNDILYGYAGDDLIEGDGGRDELHGGAGDDVLRGGAGDDFLSGNRDVDLCDGGVGGETIGDRAASCETVLNIGQTSSGCRSDTTMCVGPGQQFETLAAAVGAATDGAVIEVRPGTYNETVAVLANDITIRSSPGPEPTIDCSGIRPAWGKACILAVGTNLTIERLRVTGARWTSGNEACFRNEPGTHVTIRGATCFGSNNGILGSGGSWLVVDSTFRGNGAGDGQTHNLYFSGDCSRVVLRRTTSERSNGGHAFKSRCAVSTIEDSVLIENAVADGADFSDGGVATIRNSRIEQPDGSNGNMVRHGSESCSNGGRLRIEGSVIASARAVSYIISTCASIQIVDTQLPSGINIVEP